MSLRNRVTLGTVLVLVLGLAVLSVALNFLLINRLSADASSVLAGRAATLGVDSDALLDEHAWVFDADGHALQRSPASPKVLAGVQRLARVTRPTETNPTEHMRLLAKPVGDKVVVVGVSMDPYRHTERIAVGFTIVLDLFVLLAGALLARRAVGAALRPVADMTERARDWSEHDLHQRFAHGPPHDELTGLAATLDGMLGRIDAALRHEQRFSAEMAHELRTPLSSVRAEAELALRGAHSNAELRAALESVLEGTDRMAAVIETLLTAARGDAARGSSDAVATVRGLARHDPRVYVHADAEPLTVGAGEEVVAAALHPLLENAVRHAENAVEITLARADGDVVITVTDDGAGIGDADAERIFEPGVSGTGGAGLGLPLARRLARAAGGDVLVVDGSFELRLPS